MLSYSQCIILAMMTAICFCSCSIRECPAEEMYDLELDETLEVKDWSKALQHCSTHRPFAAEYEETRLLYARAYKLDVALGQKRPSLAHDVQNEADPRDFRSADAWNSWHFSRRILSELSLRKLRLANRRPNEQFAVQRILDETIELYAQLMYVEIDMLLETEEGRTQLAGLEGLDGAVAEYAHEHLEN